MSLLGLSMMSVAARGAPAVAAASTPQYAAWPSLIGAEMMVNGDCSSATGWTLGAGTAIALGKMTMTAVSADSTNSGVPDGVFIVGATYRNVFTIDTVSLGSAKVTIGTTVGTARSTTATFSQDLVYGGTGGWKLTGTTATMQLDNFSVKSVGLMGVEADWSFVGAVVFGTPATTGSTDGVLFDGATSGDTASLTGSALTAFNAAVSNSTACTVSITVAENYSAGSVEIQMKGGAFVDMVVNAGGIFTKAITSGAGSGFVLRAKDEGDGTLLLVQRIQITPV